MSARRGSGLQATQAVESGSRGRMGWTVLATTVALLLAIKPTPGATQAPVRSREELRGLMAGAWYLTGTEEQGQAAIDRGIDRAVAEMNYFLQGVTRTQIREKTPLNRRIDIQFPNAGQQILVNFDQRFEYITTPGRGQDFDLPDGTSVNVNQFFRGQVLEQQFVTTLGRRWNVYELLPDGQTLRVTATTQGPMMPRPVVFTLEYRRRE